MSTKQEDHELRDCVNLVETSAGMTVYFLGLDCGVIKAHRSDFPELRIDFNVRAPLRERHKTYAAVKDSLNNWRNERGLSTV